MQQSKLNYRYNKNKRKIWAKPTDADLGTYTAVGLSLSQTEKPKFKINH